MRESTYLADEYGRFLRAKANVAAQDGFAVDAGEINPLLKPHQRQIVEWAIRGGRRAIFAAFGIGKSVIQLEVLRLAVERAGGRGLIEQEAKRIWRVMAWNLKARLVAIEEGVETFAEAFLAHLVDPTTNQTIYERLSETGVVELPAPLLALPPGEAR